MRDVGLGRCRVVARLVIGALLSVVAGTTPGLAQARSDALPRPVPHAAVNDMVTLADLQEGDVVFELGSPDARFSARAAFLSKRVVVVNREVFDIDAATKTTPTVPVATSTGKLVFVEADPLTVDLSEATVVDVMLPADLAQLLVPRLLRLRPGTRIVSTSPLGDWFADATVEADAGCTPRCLSRLWVVPAPVDGPWETPMGTLKLKQIFQRVSGVLETRLGGQLQLLDLRLRGGSLQFRVSWGTQLREYKADFVRNILAGEAGLIPSSGGGHTWTGVRPTPDLPLPPPR